MRKIDLTGRRFGRLTVAGENPSPYISPVVEKWEAERATAPAIRTEESK